MVRRVAGVCVQQKVEHDLIDTYSYACIQCIHILAIVILENGVVSLGVRWYTYPNSAHLRMQEVCLEEIEDGWV